jgi:hypothetical protein
MMVEVIRAARGEPLPENPPPGPKWQAKEGINVLRTIGVELNGTEVNVLFMLVEHANTTNGVCYPCQELISRRTCRPLRSVERAIASLKRKRLIDIIPVAYASNRYIINWTLLFDAHHQSRKIARAWQRKRALAKSGGQLPAKSGGQAPAKSGGVTYQREPMKKNLGPKTNHRPPDDGPLVADMTPFLKIKTFDDALITSHGCQGELEADALGHGGERGCDPYPDLPTFLDRRSVR